MRVIDGIGRDENRDHADRGSDELSSLGALEIPGGIGAGCDQDRDRHQAMHRFGRRGDGEQAQRQQRRDDLPPVEAAFGRVGQKQRGATKCKNRGDPVRKTLLQGRPDPRLANFSHEPGEHEEQRRRIAPTQPTQDRRQQDDGDGDENDIGVVGKILFARAGEDVGGRPGGRDELRVTHRADRKQSVGPDPRPDVPVHGIAVLEDVGNAVLPDVEIGETEHDETADQPPHVG